MGEGKAYGNSEIKEGGKVEAATNSTTILVEQRDGVIFDKDKALPLFSEMDFGMNDENNGENNKPDDTNEKNPFNWTLFLSITIPVVAVGIGTAVAVPLIIKKKKQNKA